MRKFQMAVSFAMVPITPTFKAVKLYTIYVSASPFCVGNTFLVAVIIYFVFKEIWEAVAPNNKSLSNKHDHNQNTVAIVQNENS